MAQPTAAMTPLEEMLRSAEIQQQELSSNLARIRESVGVGGLAAPGGPLEAGNTACDSGCDGGCFGLGASGLDQVAGMRAQRVAAATGATRQGGG